MLCFSWRHLRWLQPPFSLLFGNKKKTKKQMKQFVSRIIARLMEDIQKDPARDFRELQDCRKEAKSIWSRVSCLGDLGASGPWWCWQEFCSARSNLPVWHFILERMKKKTTSGASFSDERKRLPMTLLRLTLPRLFFFPAWHFTKLRHFSAKFNRPTESVRFLSCSPKTLVELWKVLSLRYLPSDFSQWRRLT